MRIFIVLILCVLSHIAMAQRNYEYRYWFDTADLSAQVGTTNDSAFHLDIDASSLSTGLHTFNYQIINTANTSITQTALFYKSGINTSKGYEYRYWFDNMDVAAHVETSTTGILNMNLDAEQLSTGLHTFNFQVIKDGRGESKTQTALFYKYPFTSTDGYSYRYWFDTADSLAVTATTTSHVVALDIDAANLATGLHTFNFQVVDKTDNYSSTKKTLFYKAAIYGENHLDILIDGRPTTAYELKQAGNSLFQIELDAASLPLGIHTLTVQLMDDKNIVSSIAQSVFMKVATEADISDLKMYYYIDEQAQEKQPCNWINGVAHADLDMSALTDGTHSITFILANANGLTLQAQTATFVKEPIVVTSVALDKTELALTVGETFQLTATVLPEKADNKNVTWSSSDAAVATVENGLVTAVGNGEATITVTTIDGGFVDSCTVTVTTPVSGVELNKSHLDLLVGETFQLEATVLPATASNKAVNWTTSNAAVASVENGLVTAIGNGETTITVTTVDGGFVDSCTVTVTTPISGVELNKSHLDLFVDDTFQLEATVLPETASNKAVTWTTSDAAVATVENGLITAVASGIATITVTTVDGGYQTTCEVTVKDPVITSLNLRVDHIALYPNESYILNTVVAPAKANKKTLVWSSSDEYIATVSEGVVTAHNTGKATITVATPDQSLTATCLLTVVDTDFANDILVETTDNSALFTWAKVADAYKYVFAIYTDEAKSQLVCNVTCNAWGQLMDITFPSKKPAAEQPALGTLLQFTIGGLSSGTVYNFTLNGYNEEDGIVLNKEGQFVTTGNSSTTGVETPYIASPDKVRKVFHNGTIYIIKPNGDKYTIDGRKVN